MANNDFIQWSDFYLTKFYEYCAVFEAEAAKAAELAEYGSGEPEAQFPESFHNLLKIIERNPQHGVRFLHAQNNAAFATIQAMLAHFQRTD